MATGDPNDKLEWELRCLAEVERGNRRAFGELYSAYAPPLYSQVLLPRLGSPVAGRLPDDSAPRWAIWGSSRSTAATGAAEPSSAQLMPPNAIIDTPIALWA